MNWVKRDDFKTCKHRSTAREWFVKILGYVQDLYSRDHCKIASPMPNV